MPAFSILIPTKNRPEVLGDAITSVLRQTFEDWELIISINDDDSRTSMGVVNSFAGDGRIKAVVTDGNLSMPANWENALSRATGDYITVLEDKMVLYPDALETLHADLEFNEPDVAMWRYDTWQDNSTLIKMLGKGTTQMVPSEVLIKNFIQHGFQFGMALRQNCNTMLPRMINSCVKREVVAKIQETSSAFFLPVNPDFTSAFQQLRVATEVLFIDASLSIWGPASKSNARNIRSQGNSRFFDDIAKDWKLASLTPTPIESQRLINNLEYGDYLRLIPNGPHLKNEDYALMILLDIIRTYKKRALSSVELREWRYFVGQQCSPVLFAKILKAGFALSARGALYKMVMAIPAARTNPRPGHWSLLSGFSTSLEAASSKWQV